jgi:chromosome segregation ATPase
MSDRDAHLEVLRAMWGEMKTLNARVNTTNERLETGFAKLDGRMDAIGEMLGARIEASNERLDRLTEEVREGFAHTRLDRRRLDRLERRVDGLERREK